jgi:hypothetical protein
MRKNILSKRLKYIYNTKKDAHRIKKMSINNANGTFWENNHTSF